MAVSDDNRGGTDRPVAQRPDGSWHLEDARKRREQRQAAQTAPAPPTTGEPEEDFSALALSLADNAMTTDGTPLSQLETRQELDGSAAPGRAARDAPTAEEIMRALEAEQHAAAPTGNNGAEGPRRAQSPHQPSTRQGPHRRRLHARRTWVIACALGAAVAALLAVGVTFRGGATTRRQPSRSAASGTAAPTAGLIAAATEKFVAMEHAADRTLSPTRPRSSHALRPRGSHARQTLPRVSTRAPSGSPSRSMTTSSTSGTSEAVDTTEQASAPSSSRPSTSTSSGSGQGSPATQPHTSPSSNSGSSSASPSKATLRSLVTGAGTCGCQ